MFTATYHKYPFQKYPVNPDPKSEISLGNLKDLVGRSLVYTLKRSPRGPIEECPNLPTPRLLPSRQGDFPSFDIGFFRIGVNSIYFLDPLKITKVFI